MWSKAEPGKAGGRKAGSQRWRLRDDGGPPSSVHQCLFPAYYGSRTDAVDETGVLHVSRSLRLSGESDIRHLVVQFVSAEFRCDKCYE